MVQAPDKSAVTDFLCSRTPTFVRLSPVSCSCTASKRSPFSSVFADCLVGVFALSPALVEGVYLDTVVRVLLQDLICVLVCVEGVHEDQGHIGVVGLVQVLREVKKKTTTYKQTHTHTTVKQFEGFPATVTFCQNEKVHMALSSTHGSPATRQAPTPT